MISTITVELVAANVCVWRLVLNCALGHDLRGQSRCLFKRLSPEGTQELAVERLRAFLRRHRRIALDTSVFIYQLEGNARYLALTDHVFTWLERPDSLAVTSTITMTELLVQPYRNFDEHRVDEFYGLLSTYPNLNWISPDLEIADLAARLRALHHLRTPDALQAATAAHGGATGFMTNDPAFERIKTFETLVLDSIL